MKKSWFGFSGLVNVLFLAAVLVLLFNPSAKALAIRGLMSVGLFQPDISQQNKRTYPAFPDVVFKSPNNTELHLASLKGKVIFINFWATWCPPCIAEMPSIQKLYDKLKNNKNIVFIMVDADSNFQKSVPFMSKKGFTMPLYAPAGGVPSQLVSNAIPATTVIDKNGQIAFHNDGAADYGNAKVVAWLEKLAK